MTEKKVIAKRIGAVLLSFAIALAFMPLAAQSVFAESANEGADEQNTQADEQITSSGSVKTADTSSEDITFTASTGGNALTDITKEENGYTYTPWSGSAYTVPVYTVKIPKGTTSVDLAFSANVLAYNYSSDGTYLDPDRYYQDSQTGDSKATVKINANTESSGTEGTQYYIPADTDIDLIYVQTPYDSTWNSELKFVITFEYEDIDVGPFTVSSSDWQNGKKAELPDGYTWTEYPEAASGKTLTAVATYYDSAAKVSVDVETEVTFLAAETAAKDSDQSAGDTSSMVKSTDTDDTDDGSETQTGDDTPVYALMALMGMSLIVSCGTYAYRKRM